jgi:hypothetical protein
MNKFSKVFLIILGVLIGLTGVLSLQNVALELLSAPSDGQFYLGIFYLAIVLFIWISTVYYAANYLVGLKDKKGSNESEQN